MFSALDTYPGSTVVRPFRHRGGTRSVQPSQSPSTPRQSNSSAKRARLKVVVARKDADVSEHVPDDNLHDLVTAEAKPKKKSKKLKKRKENPRFDTAEVETSTVAGEPFDTGAEDINADEPAQLANEATAPRKTKKKKKKKKLGKALQDSPEEAAPVGHRDNTERDQAWAHAGATERDQAWAHAGADLPSGPHGGPEAANGVGGAAGCHDDDLPEAAEVAAEMNEGEAGDVPVDEGATCSLAAGAVH